MHILTGQNGYLLSHILPHVPLDGYCYHFGCPINSRSDRNKELLNKHLKDTEDIVQQCRQNNLKLIYASSMSVVSIDPDTQYKTTKIIAESMLDLKKDLIWRIPRVYSLDRGRGLVPELKRGITPRPENVLQWVYLGDFITDFVASINDTGIRAYRGPYQRTKVKDILKKLEEIEAK